MTLADLPLPSGADRIELLQTFVRIVESGSLSAAAQQMSTTQPTVSRRLQTLERALATRPGRVDLAVEIPLPGPEARIRLFRRPILDEWAERGDVTPEQLVSHVLVHEVGHHFGLSDEAMHTLEEQAG